MSSEQMRNSNFRDAFEMKLAQLGVFRKFSKRFSFQVIYPIFQKRPKSESLETSWAVITLLVHILDEISHVFLKTWQVRGFFWLLYLFFQKETSFEHFQKFLSINTIPDACYRKNAKVSNFIRKNQDFSPKKKHLFFQEIQVLIVSRTLKH